MNEADNSVSCHICSYGFFTSNLNPHGEQMARPSSRLNRYPQTSHFTQQALSALRGPIAPGLFVGQAQRRLRIYADGARGHNKRIDVLRDGLANGSTPNSVAYAKFERAFLSWLGALDWSTVIDVADTEGIKKSEEKIAELQLSSYRNQSARK